MEYASMTEEQANSDWFVCCADDFPRCMSGSMHYPVGIAKKRSECECEIARDAVFSRRPQVTLKATQD